MASPVRPEPPLTSEPAVLTLRQRLRSQLRARKLRGVDRFDSCRAEQPRQRLSSRDTLFGQRRILPRFVGAFSVTNEKNSLDDKNGVRLGAGRNGRRFICLLREGQLRQQQQDDHCE